MEMTVTRMTTPDPRFSVPAVACVSSRLKRQQSVLKSDMGDISNPKMIYLYKSFNLMLRLLS